MGARVPIGRHAQVGTGAVPPEHHRQPSPRQIVDARGAEPTAVMPDDR
jgi:hypothetical protein